MTLAIDNMDGCRLTNKVCCKCLPKSQDTLYSYCIVSGHMHYKGFNINMIFV